MEFSAQKFYSISENVFILQEKRWSYETEANVILIDIKTKMSCFHIP